MIPLRDKAYVYQYCTLVLYIFQGFVMSSFSSSEVWILIFPPRSVHTHLALSRQQLVGSMFVQAEVIGKGRG